MTCCLAEPFPVYVWRRGCLNFGGNETESIHKGYGGLIPYSFSVSSSFALARILSTSFLVRARDSSSPPCASSFGGTSLFGGCWKVRRRFSIRTFILYCPCSSYWMHRATSLCDGGCSEFMTKTFTLRESNEDTVLVTELELILLDEEPRNGHFDVLRLKE